MVEKYSNREKSPEEIRRMKALRGMGFLTLASVECPSAGFAQSAKIASLCKTSGDDPLALKSALLAEDDILEKLAANANKLHELAQRKPDYAVEAVDVINLIFVDFTFAKELMGLTPEQLAVVTTQYYQEYRSQKLSHNVMEGRVRELIPKPSGLS